MAEVTLSSKNQIVIPREARESMGLKPGDKLLVAVSGRRIIILRKPTSYATALRGLGPGVYPDDYLKKEREGWD